MRTHTYLILILISSVFIINSCSKKEDEETIVTIPAGTGGKAAITGHVMHHDDAIPNAMVYIKYGATELPGTTPNVYDDSTQASASDAHYKFEGLQKGNYYVFGTGYDTSCVCNVFGGVSILISMETETVESNVPVTE